MMYFKRKRKLTDDFPPATAPFSCPGEFFLIGTRIFSHGHGNSVCSWRHATVQRFGRSEGRRPPPPSIILPIAPNTLSLLLIYRANPGGLAKIGGRPSRRPIHPVRNTVVDPARRRVSAREGEKTAVSGRWQAQEMRPSRKIRRGTRERTKKKNPPPHGGRPPFRLDAAASGADRLATQRVQDAARRPYSHADTRAVKGATRTKPKLPTSVLTSSAETSVELRKSTGCVPCAAKTMRSVK